MPGCDLYADTRRMARTPARRSADWCSIMASVAQAIFSNLTLKDLAKIDGIIPLQVFGAGASGFRSIVSPEQLPRVLEAFNKGITSTFCSWPSLSRLLMRQTPAPSSSPSEPSPPRASRSSDSRTRRARPSWPDGLISATHLVCSPHVAVACSSLPRTARPVYLAPTRSRRM